MKLVPLVTASLLSGVALIVFLSMSGNALQARQTDAGPRFEEYRGVLLNEQCATRQPEWLPFADEHGLDCAMLPICFLSGYYLIIDENTVMKLDRRGDLLARSVLQKTDKESDFRVVIRGDLNDSILNVHSIAEQG